MEGYGSVQSDDMTILLTKHFSIIPTNALDKEPYYNLFAKFEISGKNVELNLKEDRHKGYNMKILKIYTKSELLDDFKNNTYQLSLFSLHLFCSYKNSQLHCYNNEPICRVPNQKEWWVEGERHRDDDLPAIEYYDNGRIIRKEWWLEGKRHRDDDLPATESATTCEWWKDGERHRKDNLPSVIITVNNLSYYKHYVNNKLHRDNDLPAIYDSSGTKEWWVEGERHRENDLPAVEYYEHGRIIRKEWWYKNKRHRENDLPAVEHYNSNKTIDKKEWWVEGERHRENDLPAVEQGSGIKEWWYKNKLHREDDKPAIIRWTRSEWWLNNKLHRDNDLPAVIEPGTKEWWLEGKRHRDDDLPAIEYDTGAKEWWIEGKRQREYDKPAVITSSYKEWWLQDTVPIKKRPIEDDGDEYNNITDLIRQLKIDLGILK